MTSAPPSYSAEEVEALRTYLRDGLAVIERNTAETSRLLGGPPAEP